MLTAPLLGSLLDGDRFLSAVAAHPTRLQVAALFQIEAMALGAVGFRHDAKNEPLVGAAGRV